jgi:leader peptidase (prepilin peptidase)/N-methyltransferase
MVIINIAYSIIIGWSVGVIINYLSDTLPSYRKLQYPECGNCRAKYSVLNILFGRKCDYCNTKRSLRFWSVLTLLVIASGYVLFVRGGNASSILIDIFVFSYLTLITVIDIEHHLVLNVTMIFGIVFMGATGLLIHGWKVSLLGGIIGFGFMLILYLLGQLYGRIISKKRAIEVDDILGFGDVCLCGVCGLLLGFPGVITCIFLAIILGGLWSIGAVLLAKVRYESNPLMHYIAYAPFITLAAAILWSLQN